MIYTYPHTYKVIYIYTKFHNFKVAWISGTYYISTMTKQDDDHMYLIFVFPGTKPGKE